ncbi:hypothetical protein TELCIR_22815 [Teladorsagia circumcincta]|uniref:Nuclear pore complex protein NUP96 C-terminal domain-containing protein n=1 Tax=Teladorsagia circumcincta TaxID=45464 RepID=A0A2G9TCU8_TELCI|nr:hypothetical protein TELCIR_22815 [Teladorsagia circumcincta]
MCAGDSEEAMRIASEDGMTMLSSMISEALSAEEKGRGDCADMLESWEKIGDIGTMEEDLLKIYLVLAGKTHLEFQHRGKTIKLNCLEGLDWRQAFGIHLWWVNCGGFLEDAVDSFSEDVAAGRAASPDLHVFEQAQGNYELACSYALTAGDYAAALRLFAEEVAPNAIAMGDLQNLRPLAERMEKAADKITVHFKSGIRAV